VITPRQFQDAIDQVNKEFALLRDRIKVLEDKKPAGRPPKDKAA
jgi:hypothetical protein